MGTGGRGRPRVTPLTSLIRRNHWSLLMWLTLQRITLTAMLRLPQRGEKVEAGRPVRRQHFKGKKMAPQSSAGAVKVVRGCLTLQHPE